MRAEPFVPQYRQKEKKEKKLFIGFFHIVIHEKV